MQLTLIPIVWVCDRCQAVTPVFYAGDHRPAYSWKPATWTTVEQEQGDGDTDTLHFCPRCSQRA